MQLKLLPLFFLGSLFLLPSITTGDELMQEKLMWYPKDAVCDSVKIEEFTKASDKQPARQVTSTDARLIGRIKTCLDQLPVKGNEYISFSPDVPRTLLWLNCDGKPTRIEFYNGAIKTPATSFFSKDNLPQEKALFDLIEEELRKVR